MKLRSQLSEAFSPVVDLVYPPRCPLCGTGLSAQSGLCTDCWCELEVPGQPACRTCQRPIGESTASGLQECFVCRSEPPLHSGIHAATLYNDASRRLILAFKHGGKISLAPLLARLIAARLRRPEGNTPLLVPVPLHRWRLWQRGYNQAALLARELERLGHGELLVDGLIRHKRTPSLGGLGREQREQTLKGAISTRPRAARRMAGKDVILVDDVLTSGATSHACTRALLEAGAQSVRIACFARVTEGISSGTEDAPSGALESETPEVN